MIIKRKHRVKSKCDVCALWVRASELAQKSKRMPPNVEMLLKSMTQFKRCVWHSNVKWCDSMPCHTMQIRFNPITHTHTHSVLNSFKCSAYEWFGFLRMSDEHFYYICLGLILVHCRALLYSVWLQSVFDFYGDNDEDHRNMWKSVKPTEWQWKLKRFLSVGIVVVIVAGHCVYTFRKSNVNHECARRAMIQRMCRFRAATVKSVLSWAVWCY